MGNKINDNISTSESEFDEQESADLKVELTDLHDPFNPSEIDIQAVQTTLDTVVKRIKHNEIDLQPEFQRSQGLWKSQIMSRLIESLLIRFPLPAFYFDATDDDKWQVVDGLQRLTTIKKFIVDKKLKLNKLEFLHQFNGFCYGELPRPMQRRIEEAQITMYLIRPGTPPEVKFSLFYRINTGGLQLTAQEIRHAISQCVNNGQASTFLKKITCTKIFKEVGRISGKRMLDKELVLRFMALKLTPYTEYKAPMISFLNKTMEKLGVLGDEELQKLEDEILNALTLSYEIFGEDAFRKSLVENKKIKVVNRALFEAVSVLFSELTLEESNVLKCNKDEFLIDFKKLFEDKTEFYPSITSSTADPTNVVSRFNKIKAVISRHIV